MRLRAPLLAVAAVAVIAGCGSSSGGSSTETGSDTSVADDGNAKTVVAALGDSITAGTPLWDPDEAIRAQIGAAADERSQWEYWAARDDPSLEFNNCGVNGERTDEIALRLDDCADGADALVVQGGINDIAQGMPVEAAAENLRGMVVRGKELGLQVVMVEVLPWNNGYPAADAPIKELNGLISQIGEDEDVPVMPWYSALEDPDRPGTMKDDLTIEGDHPSVAGYRILGESTFELPGA